MADNEVHSKITVQLLTVCNMLPAVGEINEKTNLVNQFVSFSDGSLASAACSFYLICQ